MKIQIEIDVKSLKKDFFGRVREYARYLGCSHNTIADRLSGKIKIHFEDLNEMSDFLGRDPRDYIQISYGSRIYPIQVDCCEQGGARDV